MKTDYCEGVSSAPPNPGIHRRQTSLARSTLPPHAGRRASSWKTMGATAAPVDGPSASWALLPCTGEVPAPRTHFGAAAVGNWVYVVGGTNTLSARRSSTRGARPASQQVETTHYFLPFVLTSCPRLGCMRSVDIGPPFCRECDRSMRRTTCGEPYLAPTPRTARATLPTSVPAAAPGATPAPRAPAPRPGRALPECGVLVPLSRAAWRARGAEHMSAALTTRRAKTPHLVDIM